VDVFTGENRHAPYLAHNPAGQTPTLLLDDGTSIAESISIMEYLEELYPSPALIGVSARQRDGDTAMAAAHRTQHHREHPQRVSLCRRIGALS
jgi:glutathione S-transferase